MCHVNEVEKHVLHVSSDHHWFFSARRGLLIQQLAPNGLNFELWRDDVIREHLHETCSFQAWLVYGLSSRVMYCLTRLAGFCSCSTQTQKCRTAILDQAHRIKIMPLRHRPAQTSTLSPEFPREDELNSKNTMLPIYNKKHGHRLRRAVHNESFLNSPSHFCLSTVQSHVIYICIFIVLFCIDALNW